MRCFFCAGVAHPATGHAWTSSALACRRCYLDFFAWYRARMHNPIATVALADRERRQIDLTKRLGAIITAMSQDEEHAVVHVRPTVVLADGRIVRGHPAGTVVVAMSPAEDGRHDVGVAFRNPKDRWDGRLGRVIAAGRMATPRKGRMAFAPSADSAGEDFRRTRLLVAALQYVQDVHAEDLIPAARDAVRDTTLRLAEALERARERAKNAVPPPAPDPSDRSDERRVPRRAGDLEPF